MANNQIGKLRRSTVVMTFGPGAVVDFRADGGAVSAVSAGLDEWDRSFPQAGLINPQRIAEPRLERKLGVRGFRLPPVVDEDWRDGNGQPDNRSLVAVRFPEWLQCPECDQIGPASFWGDDPGRAYRYCRPCTAQAPGMQKRFAIPVRFVMACDRGHIDDFPWHTWVGHRPECRSQRFLILKSVRPGLAYLILSCPSCGASRSMDGIFNADTWRDFTCRGRRPWLPVANETCNSGLRALQRGASNLYFPVIESALSIPPWSDRLQEALGVYWSAIVNVPAAQRADFIRILAGADLGPALAELRITPEELSRRVEERVAAFTSGGVLDIRQEEYRQLTSGVDTRLEEDREFEIRNVRVPDSLRLFFNNIVRTVRLREVRAIRGFTRINPPASGDDPRIAPLSSRRLDWLPAIEVRGEGIFLAFNPSTISDWEQLDIVKKRAEIIDGSWRTEWRSRFGDGDPPLRISGRFLLAHTFAHALIRQLTLDCGYSSASLRERLYVDEHNMAGVLIYTATSDSDGTLGGLQRQGEAVRIERTIPAAIRAMEWCSSDPLCIEGMTTSSESHSLSACHACVLAPETSCEEFNRFLDRSALVGLPEEPAAGFFSRMLGG